MKKVNRILAVLLIVICSCSLNYYPVCPVMAAEKAAINKGSVTITEGKTFQLTVTNLKDIDWFSNNESVARINKKGLITAVSAGKAKIYATDGKTTLTCMVTVKEKAVKGKDIKSKQVKYSENKLKAAKDSLGKSLFKKAYYESDFYNSKENQLMCIDIKESTNWGTYGYCDAYLDIIQDKIKTVEDLMAYFVMSNYQYDEDDRGYMGMARAGWGTKHSAKINLSANCGVCSHTASVAAYLLEDDYDEIGFVMINGRNGHEYNYVKQDGIYYFIDFTDFTSDNSKYDIEAEDVWSQWKDKICFWSGSSLNSASATKAALIHDTYDYAGGNCRSRLDLSFNEKNTGVIIAIKYYSGMEGAEINFMTDQSNQQQVYDDGKSIGFDNGDSYVTVNVKPAGYIGIAMPEKVDYQVLWINYTTNYCGAVWKELKPIPTKLVPYFITLPWDKESYIEKFKRQTKNSNYALLNTDEVRVGAAYYILLASHYIFADVSEKHKTFDADFVKQWFADKGISVTVK